MKNEVSEVKEKTDIVQIIGEHITLKKAGKIYKGLCPFHNEKTPSFTVSPELQMYKCFGCGKSGDCFTFLEEYEGLEFPDALKVLAVRAGVALSPFKKEEGGQKDILYEVNEVAAKYYHYVLLNLPSGESFRSYLTQKRGVNKETITSFMLGAAPDNPHALFDFLTKKRKYAPEVLLTAGLVYKTDRGVYIDRFRGRIIFPIQNIRGAVVALAGRVLPTLPKANLLAKYINSPETPIYHKSDSLFGISEAREAIKRSGIGIIVEGELDMITPFQAGIKNIVAIKGSTLTESHARLLSRIAKTVVLALDSDFAGSSAAIKGISEAQNAGLIVKVADLGKYKDPDEFVKSDAEGFKKALEKAQNVWDFIIDTYFKRFDPETIEGKSGISKELLPHIGSIDDPILKAHYVRLIAGRLNVPEEAISGALASENSKKAPPKFVQEKKTINTTKNRRELLEERLLAVLCLERMPQEHLNEALNLIKTPFVMRLAKELSRASEKNFVLSNFAKSLPNELKENFLSIVMGEEQLGTSPTEEFKKIVHELKEIALKEEITTLSEKVKGLDKEGKDTEVSAIQEKIGELTSMLAKEKG